MKKMLGLAAVIVAVWVSPAAAIPNANHYLCHQVKDLKVPAKFASLIVASLVDQTGSFNNCTAKKPKFLCNPVDKNNSGIVDANLHYCCYQVKCLLKVAASYDITDQFGILRLQTKKPKFLCNPCNKEPL